MSKVAFCVRSNWYDESSRTISPCGTGGARPRTGGPKFPPICTLQPARCRIWWIRADVVDLPLVPVIPIRIAPPRFSVRSSMSPIIGRPALRAQSTTGCGVGWVSGTPGLRTSAENPLQSDLVRSANGIFSLAASTRDSALSSQAVTVAPPAVSACAVARPDAPRPKTAMC